MIDIEFIKKDNKAIAYDDNKKIGECVYETSDNVWNIIHTEVDNTYQGQGIAKKLVECIIENAKKENKKLIASCSYAKILLERLNKKRG